jgi:pimeloyl-ACP methyl ester carboxylesterase
MPHPGKDILKNGIKRTAILSLLVAAALLAACLAGNTPSIETAPRIHLEACQLSGSNGSNGKQAQCGSLKVYEDRAGGSGRQIDLHVEVIPAVSRSPEPDPLFIIVGGPGEAASSSYAVIASAFERINQRRDIVLVDQRGTGKSHPLLCPDTVGEDYSSESDPDELRKYAQGCLTELDADPRFYTTSIAMDDLDQVRQGLGYKQINLYGISYGTRAALVYLRQYPDRVRSVILDGVAPPNWILGPSASADAQRAVEQIIQRCSSDEVCRKAFPNLQTSFDGIFDQLREQPVQLSLQHPVSGEMIDFTLTGDYLATTIHGMTYSPETAALLPLMVHSAYTQADFSSLVAFGLSYTNTLGEAISQGMRFSVICAEDVPMYADQEMTQGYLGNSIVTTFNEICKIWPRGETPEVYHEPVYSTAPVLLISGEADPVTPPSNAELAAKTLPNSLHLVAPGQGHGNIMRGCIPALAADFVESGSIQGLDSECVENLGPLPFFINYAGPAP